MSERGQKRSGSGGGDRGGKRSKWQSSGGGTGSGQAIPAGQHGVFVTCEAGRERRSGDEVVAMLEEAFEQLGATGLKKQQAETEAAAPAAEQLQPPPKQSIDELLAQEVAVLKDKRKDRFKYHDTGVRGSFFLAFPEDEEGAPDPVAVALHIVDKVTASKQLNARYTTRVMPITHTCFAGSDEIKALANKALAADFPAGEGVKPIGFAVEAELRAHNQLKRMEVIDAIVLHVQTPPHKVNLNHPDKVILVQVIRNAVGLAVVPRYREVFKFNLQRAAEPEEEEEEEERPAAKAATAKAGAQETRAQGAATATAQEGESTRGAADATAAAAEADEPGGTAATGTAAAGEQAADT